MHKRAKESPDSLVKLADSLLKWVSKDLKLAKENWFEARKYVMMNGNQFQLVADNMDALIKYVDSILNESAISKQSKEGKVK